MGDEDRGAFDDDYFMISDSVDSAFSPMELLFIKRDETIVMSDIFCSPYMVYKGSMGMYFSISNDCQFAPRHIILVYCKSDNPTKVTTDQRSGRRASADHIHSDIRD